MSEIHEPAYEFGTIDRQLTCRVEMEAAMHDMFAVAIKLGWHDIELAVALADAVDDYVIALAQARSRSH